MRVIIVRCQLTTVTTKESVVSVCNKPYHTNKRKVHTEEMFFGTVNYQRPPRLSMYNSVNNYISILLSLR